MTADDGEPQSACNFCLVTLLALCAAVVLLYKTSSVVRFYVKCFLYFNCIILAGTVGAILSLPNGRSTKNHL